MGSSFSRYTASHLWKEDEPDSHAPIKYDHRFGFEQERRLISMPATEEEMDSANMELEVRDYCVDVRMDYRACLRHNAPLFYRCNDVSHDLEHCYKDERFRLMKEFERERRLNVRERRISQKAQI